MNDQDAEIKTYGSVELEERWGSDEDIARRARVSTGSENKGRLKDRRLLRTLIENDHGSPLELAGIVYRLRMPIYLVAQMQRHRMASYSQRSGRYVEMALTFHRPHTWRKQGDSNRQVSGGPIDDQVSATNLFADAIAEAVHAYTRLLEMGVSREQARIVLPGCVETELYVQFNLRSLMNFLRLRTAPDAQGEMRMYASAMEMIFATQFPLTYQIYRLAQSVEADLADDRRELWHNGIVDIENGEGA